jgi:hypothetical protein
MPDDTPNPFAHLDTPQTAIQPPRLSDSAIAAYREMLADKEFENRHPQQFAAIRDSVAAALAETGQSLETPIETLAQAYDRRRGIISGADGSTQLPTFLHEIVQGETEAGKPQDAAAISDLLARAGKDPAEVLSSARSALERAKLSNIKLENLSVTSLAQLAIWHRHLTLHDASRPK